jgi:tetratricopeptide (TPR) repeat protein/predicted aspartyl protease
MKAILFGLLITLTGWVPLGHAAAKCKLGKLVEIPVVMNGLRPTITAKINGEDASFLVDSGAFYSSLTPASAAQFKLRLSAAPDGLKWGGIGGVTEASVTTVKLLTLFNVPVPNVEFIVGGGEVGNGVAGLLGQNILRIADVEYDLANGAIRLIRPDGCGKSTLAYWAGSQPYSVMDINSATPSEPHTTGSAFLNGTRIHVVFDTGAATSFLSLRAAAWAGIKPGDPNMVPAGLMLGIGPRPVKSWIAPVESFKVGDEEIHNTRLRIGDFVLPIGDMLIGADFFLSHRIYVASSQRKLYFTYNGGPVFNLNRSPSVVAAADDSGQTKHAADEPTDAAALSRRGVAFAARRDFEHAIADLTRAIELNPNEPSYFYERGIVRGHSGQAVQAMADFDQALKLRPDDVPTRVARAELRLAAKDNSAVREDLDAADLAAPKEADVRFQLGTLYGNAGLFEPAIAQFNLWIASHAADARMADALSDRCGARALLSEDLDKALADCNAALKLRPGSLNSTDRRALVQLRLGHIDKAISGWSAVLSAQPQNAWALYARGVARLRKGMTAEGHADVASATALEPHIGTLGEQRNVVPP